MSKFVLTAQLQLKAPNNVAQVVSQMKKQLSGVSVNLNVQGAAQANKQVQQLSKNLGQASKSAKGLGTDFAQSVRRFSAMAIATRAVSLFTNTLGSAIKESIAFERELVKIAQVTGQTTKNLSFLTDTVSRLSTNLGVASGSLLSVSRMLSQAGLSAKETETALRTLAMTELAPTFDNITQTAEGAIAIFNQFGKGAKALEAQLGAVNAVAGQFAVESGDLIAAVRRTGGVFRAAGGDLNELIALFTSVRATTRESAESISTGLRTIFTRIQRPRTIEFMKKFGVELTDLEGKFVGPFEAVKRLSQALAGLDQGDTRFIKIAEELGGFRQIGKVIPLIQQFSTAQAALNVAQKGSSSLAKDAATAQQSLAVQITKVKEQFLELVRGVTATPIFQMMATSALTLASALVKVADTLKPILPIITAIAAVKFTKGIAGFMGGLAGNMKGFSQGGKVHAFARGGVVPGSGNRDTVPAMLTPGEFVIRKSSVAKLGAGNLEEMNKYAAGGMVSEGRHTYGPKARLATKKMKVSPEEQKRRNEKAAATRAANEAKRRQGEELDDDMTKDNSGKKLPTIGLAALHGTNKLYNQPIPNIGKRVKLQFSTLDPQQSEQYEADMRKAVGKVAGKMASELGTDIRDTSPITDAEVNTIMDKAGFANAVGAFFESALAFTGSPYEGAKSKMQINDSLDFASGLGTASKSFKGLTAKMPTDATRTAGDKGKSASKFASQVGRWFAKNPNYDIDLVEKMAEGGGVGSDTVPALLTPGEFVVNKKSAQKIGYNSLNRMNKVGKYAKGGAVKHFAGGGQAKGGGGMMGGMFDGLTGQLMGVQMALSMLTPTVDESSGTLAKMTASVMGSFNSLIGILSMSQIALSAFNVQLSAKSVGNFLKSFGHAPKTMKEFLGSLKKGAGTGRGGLGNMIGGFGKVDSGKPGMLNKLTGGRFGGNKLTSMRRDGESFAENFDLQKSIDKKISNVRKAAPKKNFVDPQNAIQRKRRADALRSLRAKRASPTSLTGQLGKRLASSKGLVGRGMGMAMRAGSSAAGALGGLGGGAVGALGTSLAAAAGPIAAFTAGMKIAGAAVSGFRDLDTRLKDAIEAQDAVKASSLAVAQAAEQNFGGVVAGVASLFGDAGNEFLLGISNFFGGKSAASIKTAIAAQVQSAKTAKALAKGSSDAARAMKELENGTISAGDALQRVTNSTQSAKQNLTASREANVAASKDKSSTSMFSMRNLGSYATLGYVDHSSQRNKQIDAQVQERSAGAIKQRAEALGMEQQLTMATARSAFSMGGSVQDAEAKIAAKGGSTPATLREEAREARKKAKEAYERGDTETGDTFKAEADFLSQSARDMAMSLENLHKEIENQRKAFQAMNLGLNSAQGAAGAFSDAMKNYQASQEAGNVSVMRSFETLEAGIGKAAVGMDPKAFQSALSETSNALKSFGADDKQIKKFEQNLSAINQAQANAEAGLKTFSQKLQDQGKAGVAAGSPESQFEGLMDTILSSLPAGMGDEVKGRLQDMLKGMDIDYSKIADGDFSQINEVFKKLGMETLDQAKAIAQAEQFYQEIITEAAKKRAAAESALVDATRQKFDYEKEAREIIASAGGPAVTSQDREKMAIDRYNAGVTSGPKLGGADAKDIAAQQQALRNRNNQINDIRTRAAQGDEAAQKQLKGESGAKLDAEQQNIAKQNQELYQTTKSLIDSKRKEIEIIKAKNKLEKDSFDALMSGDADGFLDAQATQGAINAVASGNTDDFDGDTLQRAFEELKRLQAAGVDEVGGQKIGGTGGLLEKAASATLQARGLDPATAGMTAAQQASGTPAEQAANQEIQELAGTLSAFGDIGMDAALQQMEAAKLQKEAAEKNKEKSISEMEKNQNKVIPEKPKEAARGGLIYASRGRLINFVPRGTDTVPAMLTPGEFVVNRNAVRRGNNLQALKAMNSGAQGAAAMSKGGVVYRQEGSTGPESGGGMMAGGLDSSTISKFTNALDKFNNTILQSINALQSTEFSIKLEPTTVNVNITGTSFLQTMTNELQNKLFAMVSDKMKNLKVGPDGRVRESRSEVA